jgi:MFS family permease
MPQLSVPYFHRTELRGAAAVAAVAMLIGTAFGLSTLITPLYLIYQHQLGFTRITLTLIYAVYAVGNVSALLFLGRVSDRIGRRPMAFAAIATLVLAVLLFLSGPGIVGLYAARILTGLGIGIASGTGNAWLAELLRTREKARAATIGTTANFIGIGVTPLLSGLLAQYAPWPLHLSYGVYLVILGAVAALVGLAAETVPNADRRAIDFRPRLAIPREIRARFVAPAVTGFGLMALVGFYAALMPAILSQDLQIKNHAVAGALFFELAAVVACVIVGTQRLPSRIAMLWSLGLMVPAAASIVVAQLSGSLGVMLGATAVVAVSSGLGYRGSLQVINESAPEDQRAAVMSSYFVCCFIGNAVPVIGVGILSTFANMAVADAAFAATISAFAVVALIFGLVIGAERHAPNAA